MGFPRQEYWSGLPGPSPGDLPNPGNELAYFTSPTLTVNSLPLVPPGKAPCKPKWEVQRVHVNFTKMLLFTLYQPVWVKPQVQVGNYWGKKGKIRTTGKGHIDFVAVEALQPPHICEYVIW